MNNVCFEGLNGEGGTHTTRDWSLQSLKYEALYFWNWLIVSCAYKLECLFQFKNSPKCLFVDSAASFLIAGTINRSVPTLIYKLTIRRYGQLEFKIDISCENFDKGRLVFLCDCDMVRRRYCMSVVASVRTLEIAQVFTKVLLKALFVSHNGIFLFVRSVLTVRVMYWARVEDYFYPFHEVCMHLLWTAEAASQSAQEIIVKREFWMFMNDWGFEI